MREAQVETLFLRFKKGLNSLYMAIQPFVSTAKIMLCCPKCKCFVKKSKLRNG